MLFVFLYTLLVYAFHRWGRASVSFFKPELALGICDTSVPEKVNSVLESTAFRSKRRCVRKEGETSQCGMKPKCTISRHGSVDEKHIPCNHGAFVPLIIVFACRSLQTAHSLG